MVALYILLVSIYISHASTTSLSSAPAVSNQRDYSWREDAIRKMWVERRRMGRTPLVPFQIPSMPEVEIYFKNEAESVTKSLKHRFAWCLWMWALMEGYIKPNVTVYETSSGNSAIAQSYLARMLGVPFVVTIPNDTEDVKIARITANGAKVILVENAKRFSSAEEEAKSKNGFFMKGMVNAAQAIEYHESGDFEFESTNVFHEAIQQLKTDFGVNESPDYFVHTAGGGGTITAVGRYVKKYSLPTRVVLADAEYSTYYDFINYGKFQNESGENLWVAPGLHGIGFGFCCPAIFGVTMSLNPEVVDQVFKIPDLASIASMHFLKRHGIYGGTSTGIHFLNSLSLAALERKRPHKSNKLRIVTSWADSGTMYEASYFNETWISENFKHPQALDIFHCWEDVIDGAYNKGFDPLSLGAKLCKP